MSNANVYKYGRGAEWTVGGSFSTIEYTNSSNKAKLKVANLKKPFLMRIPRQNNPIVPMTRVMTGNEIYYQKFDIERNDSAVTLSFYPESCDYGFTVYIKKDRFPTEGQYDFIFHLPHDDRWDFETNCSKDSNDSDAFKIFLSPKDFINMTVAGHYKVGLKSKPRNGSGIKDYLPANVTSIIYTSMCVFWNGTSESWITDGCEV